MVTIYMAAWLLSLGGDSYHQVHRSSLQNHQILSIYQTLPVALSCYQTKQNHIHLMQHYNGIKNFHVRIKNKEINK